MKEHWLKVVVDSPVDRVVAEAVGDLLRGDPDVAIIRIDILQPKNPESLPEDEGLRITNLIEIKTWTRSELTNN